MSFSIHLLVFSHIQSYVTIMIKFRIFSHTKKNPVFVSNYSLFPHSPSLSHPPILPACSPMLCCASAQGMLQARMVERVAMPSSRESFRPKDQTQVSQITGRFFTV